MASDWEEVNLGDLFEQSNQGVNTTTEKVEYSDDGLIVIRAKNISAYSIDYQDVVHVSEETFDKLKSAVKPKCGDILFTNIGSQLGSAALVKNNSNFIIAWNVFRIVPNLCKVNAKFLESFLNSEETGNLVRGLNASSTMPFISGKVLRGIKLNLPPLPEQKAIAHILGSLDDKIELNRQMNETLEAMAQALFKSWFVDFDPVIDNALTAGNVIPDVFAERAEQRKGIEKKDNSDIQSLFPDEFEFTEEMGWIPLGWEVTPLAALIKLTGGGTPKTSIPEYWNGDIPWFSVVDAPSSSDIFVLDTEKHVTSLGVEKSSTKILPVGTTIISARGTVGKCAMVSRPMAMNQSCYGVLGNEGISNTFVYYSVFLSVSELQSKGHGSVFNTITGDTFKSINVAFSGGRLTREFDNLVSPYFEKILTNSLQVTTLSKLRDTLLPKLMSGELRIVDAAEMVEDT